MVAKSGRYCSYSSCDKLYLVVGVLTALNTVSTSSLISTKQSLTSYTSSRVYPARALGLLLADGAPTDCGVGEDFSARLPFFFYENDCTSETTSRKINPKNAYEPSLSEGYKQAIDNILGPIAKTDFFGQNLSFWPATNTHFFTLTMLWPLPGKAVQIKKYPFPK